MVIEALTEGRDFLSPSNAIVFDDDGWSGCESGRVPVKAGGQ